jgi:hypothetical protein
MIDGGDFRVMFDTLGWVQPPCSRGAHRVARRLPQQPIEHSYYNCTCRRTKDRRFPFRTRHQSNSI